MSSLLADTHNPVAAQSTLEKRAASASFAGFASTAAAIILQIAAVPVVLTYWGADKYGMWLAVIAGFMIVHTIDGGYTAYVGNQLNVLFHADQRELARTLGSSLAICTGLGMLQLLLCVGALAAGVAPALLGVTPGSPEASDVGAALVALVLAWVLAGSFPSIIHRLLVPAGMLANSIWWGLAYQAAQFATLMGAAFAGATVLQAAFAYAGVQAAMYVASTEYVRRKLPHFFPWWRGGHGAVGLRDLYRSMALSANMGAQQAWVSGSVLIVSSLLAAATVPVFTTVRALANLGTALGGILTGALSPELVRYYATNQREKLALAIRASALSSGLMVNLSLLAVLPWAEAIYASWTRGAVSFDGRLFLCLVAAVSIANASLTHSTFLTAINSVNNQLLVTIVRSSTALVVGAALIGRLGLLGVGIGILLGESIACFMMVFLIVPRVVAAQRDPFRRFGQSEGLLTSLPVVCVSLLGMLSSKLPLILILGAAAAVLFVGWRGWMRLPEEVRIRATSVLRRSDSTHS